LRAYRGDDRIWLLPWIERSFRSKTLIDIPYNSSDDRAAGQDAAPYMFQELAIKGDRFDRIDILHIDTENRVFAPGMYFCLGPGFENVRLRAPYPDFRLPRALYRIWAGTNPSKRILSEGHAEFIIPNYDGREIRYENWSLLQQPGPVEPIVYPTAGTAIPETCWPPPDANLPATVSREAESIEFYGDLRVQQEGGLRIAVPAREPRMRALHVNFQWDPPFDQFFPSGGGADLRGEQEAMKQLLAAGNLTVADIRARLEPYVSQIVTTQAKSWFWPRLCVDGSSSTLLNLEMKHKLSYDSVRSALDDPAFRQFGAQELLVQRVVGWEGYFWRELLEDYSTGSGATHCPNCGKLLFGRRNKIFCSEEDNPKCFRARRAANRRTERDRAQRMRTKQI
jgi:hypothetical protein